MILGLDISTTKIGYSILSEELDNNFKEIGLIFPEGNTIFNKTEYSIKKLKRLIDKYNINWCFIENNLLSFASGRSSANIIVMLVTINTIITYKIEKEWNIKTKRIHPSHARKVVTGRGRTKRFKNSKRMCCHYLITQKYGRELRDQLPQLKTKVKFSKEAYDIIDSLIVALAGQKEFILDEK